jgi:hypothetical protein
MAYKPLACSMAISERNKKALPMTFPSQYQRPIQDKMDLIADLSEELMGLMEENGRQMVELSTDSIYLYICQRKLWENLKKTRQGSDTSICVLKGSDWERPAGGSSDGSAPGGENGARE